MVRDPSRPNWGFQPTNPRVRFEQSFTVKDDGCWQWERRVFQSGYGAFHYGLKNRRAHCVAYEWSHGLVPEGLELDHLCRNRACVNPDHLEPVTHHENVVRGRDARMPGAACLRGHAWSTENTIQRGMAGRRCRTCTNARTRSYRARNAAHPCPCSNHRLRLHTPCASCETGRIAT